MKTLTIDLPDEVVARAERRAAELGTSIIQEISETVHRLGADATSAASAASPPPESANVSRLLAALDKARNTESVGGLKRDELYDRNVLR